MKQVNYHTHTYRCHHAIGADEDYVKKAIEQGFKVLGFSDHTPWRYKSAYHSRIRMELRSFQSYKKSVLSLKEKYKDQIEIYFGLEAEYFPEYMDWMKEFCVQEEVDYLIFGNHFHYSDEYSQYYPYTGKESFDQYIQDCLDGMDTGLYSYLAHPELIMMNEGLVWNEKVEQGFDQICRKAKELNLPLEYNGAGFMANKWYGESYPHHKFWEIASKYHNQAIVGMDCHDPNALEKKNYIEVLESLKKYDVEIIDTIKMNVFRD